MSRFALRFPYLIIVLCMMISVIGVSMLVRLPVDLFPPINIPVVVVATFYSGMPAEQIETDITSRFERFFTLASDIDHMESRSLPGTSLIKVYFQPGSNPDTAVSALSNLALANLRRLPPGTLPPVVLKFDASSLPVCLVTFKSESMSETQIRDQAKFTIRNQIANVPGLNETQIRDNAQFTVRNQIANVPGSSVPQPFGGKYRQIMVYVDPLKLEAHQLSVMDVVNSVNKSNLILPAGDVVIGPFDYNVFANSQIETMEGIRHIPLKTVGQSSVLVGDVAAVKDAAQIQTNVVRVDGQRSAYLPVLKQGGNSNTIAIVEGIKKAVGRLVDVPKQLVSKVVFDQSVFVKTAIENLVHEGGIGLVLTGLMILIFLGSPKATIGVFFSIPLSVLATFIALYLGGGTINSMMLGGLALAFSRLIDNSVVVLENIFRHMENGESADVASEKGGSEVALPVLAATLTTVVVFFPVTFLYGVSRYLFTALALAVILSMTASYFVAMTVVPLFCSKFIKTEEASHEIGEPHAKDAGPVMRFRRWFNARFNAMLALYDRVLAWSLKAPRLTCLAIIGLFGASLFLYPLIGTAYFPRTDPGQFVVNLKADTGTRIDQTEKYVAQVEDIIRKEVAPGDLDLIVSNIGTTPDFSALYTSNSATHTAFVQTSLKENHRIGSYEYIERVRKRLSKEVPQVTAYFQSGGLVDAVLNLGLPAPMDIQIDGSDMIGAHKIATELAGRIRALPGVSDVLVPQDVDYPSLHLEIDREHAAELGLSQKDVMENVITALTSNGMIAPSYWVDPKTGYDYMLTVQYPENSVHDLAALKSIPLRAHGQATPSRLDAVCRINNVVSPTEVDHYQLRRVVDIYVAPIGEDLGKLNASVKKILANLKLPEGMRVSMRGSVQGMESSFSSFGYGLILSVLLVYLILVAQFKSFVDPVIILLAVPTGLTGVLIILAVTGTTLNIMSLMGIVMMVGIVVSNSILIVEFANRLRENGMSVSEAVSTSCHVRLRPVLMTSLATLFGLIPMALALGTGSEAYAPLARAIIGGLGVSVVLTVFIVPAAYLLLKGGKEKTAQAPTEL